MKGTLENDDAKYLNYQWCHKPLVRCFAVGTNVQKDGLIFHRSCRWPPICLSCVVCLVYEDRQTDKHGNGSRAFVFLTCVVVATYTEVYVGKCGYEKRTYSCEHIQMRGGGKEGRVGAVREKGREKAGAHFLYLGQPNAAKQCRQKDIAGQRKERKFTFKR